MLLPLAFGEHHGHPVPSFGVQLCQRGKLRANPTVVRRPVELARDQRDVQRFPRRIFRQRSLEFVLVRLVLGVRDGGETDGKCAFVVVVVVVVVIFFTITTTRREEEDEEEEREDKMNAHILSSIRPSFLLLDVSCSRASCREVFTCIKVGSSILFSEVSLTNILIGMSITNATTKCYYYQRDYCYSHHYREHRPTSSPRSPPQFQSRDATRPKPAR